MTGGYRLRQATDIPSKKSLSLEGDHETIMLPLLFLVLVMLKNIPSAACPLQNISLQVTISRLGTTFNFVVLVFLQNIYKKKVKITN